MGANTSLQEGQCGSNIPSPSKSFSRLAQQFTMSDSDLSSKDKKKKASKFATLRRKLIRVRRHSRSCDYGKPLRDIISLWSVRDISALVNEFEALIALKEIAISTNLARPPANMYRQDLSHLYHYKYCTDVDLIFRGTVFPVHRALLSIRSPFFKDLLSRHFTKGSQVPVKLRTPGVDVALFSVLLKYLYTDHINSDELRLDSQDILMKVADELGMPNPLDQDIRTLLETGDYSDAVLVFSSDPDLNDSLSSEAGSSEALNRSSKLELPCHKAILAARSPFFRNLLVRRAHMVEELADWTSSPSVIVLDEEVISRRYARVLLHSIYLDSVDLSLIMRGSTSMCSLSEVQAIVAGKGQMTLVDEAMEIYQIGQFLDFPALSQDVVRGWLGEAKVSCILHHRGIQLRLAYSWTRPAILAAGCEDLIADNITIENLLSILNWSSEPHGSKWVLRQALHFLREEFLQIVNSPVLFDLSKDHLIEALSSDFLQAGELDILSAVIKWGEHHLVRRIEKREPNILSHTAHSVSKKGVKRRDLNDVELRDILAEVLPLVRIDHVIPYNCEVLSSTIKRGLISSPPCHMISDEGSGHCVSAWVRNKNTGIYQRPRLFTPYFEEAKSVLDDQLSTGQEHEATRVRTIHMSSIPDTLYMVEDPQYIHQFMANAPNIESTVDIVSGTIPVPNMETIQLMLQREQEIQAMPQVQRANSLPCTDRRAVLCQVQLRVVREFGLPDSTIEILQNRQYYYNKDPIPVYVERNYHPAVPKQCASPQIRFKHHHRLRSPRKAVQCFSPLASPTKSYKTIATESSSSSPSSDHDNSRSATLSSTRSTLSDTIPDIAMATASINQMHLHDEIELDIGDEGASRHGTLYI